MSEESDTVVLVADDEPSTLALVSEHVRSKGFKVIEASDGDMAWQLAHQHLPDLVILDVMMPGMSGWEVCRKIRESLPLAHTGVIMLTGIGQNLNEMTSPLYGADTHIDKPFEFTELDQRINQTLQDRRKGAYGRADGADIEGAGASDVDDEDFESPPESGPRVSEEEPPMTTPTGARVVSTKAGPKTMKTGAATKKAAKKSKPKKAAAAESSTDPTPAAPPAKKTAKKAGAKKASKKTAKQAVSKKTAKKKASGKKVAKKTASKKAAKKTASKKTASKKTGKKAGAKKVAKKTASKKSSAKKPATLSTKKPATKKASKKRAKKK